MIVMVRIRTQATRSTIDHVVGG